MLARALREGATGEDVAHWQTFLTSVGLYQGTADGGFGPQTTAATKTFQSGQGLTPDGVVGNETLGKALQAGFVLAVADWVPPEPAAGVDFFTVQDPRVDVGHRIGQLPCPSNPPAPDGWAYWTGAVPAALTAFASEVENDDARFPLGCFVQAVRADQRVAARVEWHNFKGRTGEHGCFRGTSLFRRAAPVLPALPATAAAGTT
jgi:hypothetical protein